MPSCGEAVISSLERFGVSTVFGIPGVHTLELYRGLARSSLRHIAPRHEQGAGFMADGWARVTGEPGVCTLIGRIRPSFCCSSVTPQRRSTSFQTTPRRSHK